MSLLVGTLSLSAYVERVAERAGLLLVDVGFYQPVDEHELVKKGLGFHHAIRQAVHPQFLKKFLKRSAASWV